MNLDQEYLNLINETPTDDDLHKKINKKPVYDDKDDLNASRFLRSLSFKDSHRIVHNDGAVMIKRSLGKQVSALIVSVFILIGDAFRIKEMLTNDNLEIGFYLMTLIHFILTVLVLMISRGYFFYSILDFNNRIFYFGNKKTARSGKKSLGDIHSVQVIEKQFKALYGVYVVYEINLVFKGGKREHLVDFGDLKKVARLLKILKNELKVPVYRF